MVNAIYQNQGTAKKVAANAATPDATMTVNNCTNGSGWQSTQLDLGAFPKPSMYRWYAKTNNQGAPTVGNTLDIYLAWGDTQTTVDGNVSNSDAAFTVAARLNDLKYIGSVVADQASASAVFIATGVCYIPVRYVNVVWWNGLGTSLGSVTSDHMFLLTPVFDEVQ